MISTNFFLLLLLVVVTTTITRAFGITFPKRTKTTIQTPIPTFSTTINTRTGGSTTGRTVLKLMSADKKIDTIDSLDEFLEFIGGSDVGQGKEGGGEHSSSSPLCVIKFHAKWCKSCQKFGLKYHQLSEEYKDNDNVRFGSMEHGANIQLCRSLGIKKLPTVYFYQNGQKINGFPCGPAKFPLLKETLQRYSTMSQEELLFEKQLIDGEQLMSDITTTASGSPVNDGSTTNNNNDTTHSDVLQQLREKVAAASASESSTNSKSWWEIFP